MKKKFTMMGAVLVLIIGMAGLLSACGGGASINDASSLAEANEKAQAEVENYHMDMDMDMEMTVKMEGLEELAGSDSLTMPMKMTMKMDAGKKTAHAESTASMSMMGQSMDQDSEMYIDIENGATYAKPEGTSEWVKSDTDASMSDMTSGVAAMDKEILDKAKFAETEDAYTLTLDAAEVGDLINEEDFFGSYESSGMEFEEFEISSGQIIYYFDKETVLLKKAEMKDLDVNAKGEMSGSAIDMKVPMSATMDYSQYNEIDPKVYEIPEDVKNGK